MNRSYQFHYKYIDFDTKLLEAPITLKDFVYQYMQKKQILDECENNNKINKHSFFNNYIMDIFYL